MDAHAENEVHARRERRLCSCFGRGLGIEGQTDLEPLLACEGDDASQVRAGLVVDGHAVGARLAELLEMALRRLDHQMAVEHAAPRVDDRRDRLEHDRPHVIGGTKCPSPTSKWNTCTSARSSTSICSPSREKSAA